MTTTECQMNTSKEDARRTRQNNMTEDNDRGKSQGNDRRMAEEQDRTTRQKTMTEENHKENDRRTTEEHDRITLHKQTCKLTYRTPTEDYKST